MPCEQALEDREKRLRPVERANLKSTNMDERALQEIDLNLTPDDIPCSSVGNVDNIRKWTKPQLKFWLKCRRLNQPGLKKDRVEK